MKKILLCLFLILGVVSFAAPSHVDTNKAKQNGYESLMNSKHYILFLNKLIMTHH